MIKIENVDVYGWEAAIRGARNPMNSWDKSDSLICEEWRDNVPILHSTKLGPNDHKLLRNLANAGPDHGKFLRMITVTFDLTAPVYFLKEWDTYKVGTVANSCSTMHKIHAKEFVFSDFSVEKLTPGARDAMCDLIQELNYQREAFLENHDKSHWYSMIQLLPSSYNQRRTVLLNYQVLKTMYHARRNHKLDEWREFCRWVETLPYAELITGESA